MESNICNITLTHVHGTETADISVFRWCHSICMPCFSMNPTPHCTIYACIFAQNWATSSASFFCERTQTLKINTHEHISNGTTEVLRYQRIVSTSFLYSAENIHSQALRTQSNGYQIFTEVILIKMESAESWIKSFLG